ncbi:alkene reductase [bacterium]|nr:alkene reductase [bacterium]
MRVSADRSILFTPTTLGKVELANRVVMAPMMRCRATPDGVPSPLATEYYVQRASAGLIISEGTQPSWQGQGYPRTPGIHTPEQVQAWAKITGAVHQAGGKIAVQLMHVGRVGHRANQYKPVGHVAPSAIAAPGHIMTDTVGRQPKPVPRAATIDDIHDLTGQHRQATSNALSAGFDAVELHCANGYLSHQFLSTGTNQRTDEYGGSARNRCRFVMETVSAMIEAGGVGRIGIRISPGGNPSAIPDDNPLETYTVLLQALPQDKLAWVHIQPDPSGWDPSPLYEFVTAPLILTGGYDGDTAAEALCSTPAQAIGFGRPFISNPDLVQRLRHNHPLATSDPSTYFTPGPEGYTDYPAWSDPE